MNYVTLEKLNELRFAHNPIAASKLQRWCRDKKLPARRIGGEWYVALDLFDDDKQTPEHLSAAGHAQMVLDKLRAAKAGV
jgi:hypothetical protein